MSRNDSLDEIDFDEIRKRAVRRSVGRRLWAKKSLFEKGRNLESLTLLDHIEALLDLSEPAGLDERFFKKAAPYMAYLAEKLKITPLQAVLFAHFVGRGDDQDIRMEEIQESLGCKPIQLLKYLNEFDELVRRKLLLENRGHRGKKSYAVPESVLEALRSNGEIKISEPETLDIYGFFDNLERLVNRCLEGIWDNDCFLREARRLLNHNEHLTFVKVIKSYHLSEGSLSILLFFCERFVNNDDEELNMDDIRQFFGTTYDFRQARDALKSRKSALFDRGLIENSGSEGFGEADEFRLSNRAREELLSELDVNLQNAKMKRGLLLWDDIPEKTLYYNPREEKLVNKLCSILQIENFKAVEQRLRTKSLRTGFACLFYGKPGTGKTETVNLIARKTGRDIMAVDIAETKSMWFGESEKQIKKIFDRYRTYVKVNEAAPILLFNEADAVISKRKDVTTGSVTQTENAIQNIILQEMETLNGILIATTNLTQNLDTAFERRFLYKIQFEKPSLASRIAIWKSHIPELSEENTRVLAERFDFTGGQIENIARKFAVDSLIEGTTLPLEEIIEYCRDETLERERGSSIGFRASRNV